MLELNDGRNELWQWDTGRTLAVDADCSQVHFSNKVFGRSIDVDVVDGVAIIPDVLLQTDKDLTAWAFVGTPENGYTKISRVFKVNKRNKPADYVLTPLDQTTLSQIMARLDDLEEMQDPEAIKNAVDEYLANNPIRVEEKDPTVPNWAKQPTKPKYTAQEVKAVATVNGNEPDENGNVEIENSDSGLTKTEKNLILTLFKNTAYVSDAMGDIVSRLESLWNGGKVALSIKKGSISFNAVDGIILSPYASRGTLVPLCQYLEKGMTYKFSLGNAATKYSYGITVCVAASAGLTFQYIESTQVVKYGKTTERLVDTGWTTKDYTFTPEVDNCIFGVNFKINAGGNLDESHYAEILENFVFEEII